MGVRRALGVTGISQGVTFVLSFASVVIVSRLLAPEEIGIYSVAVAVLGLAHIFREFGVGHYLVQAREVSERQFRSAFGVAIITSWAIALAVFLLREPMASLYDHQGISEVLTLLSINFLILPLGTPVLAMMRRDLEFTRLACVQILGASVQATVTIYAAWIGQSYLSMAWGSIAMTLSKMLIVNVIRPGQTFVLPSFRGMNEVLKFGGLASGVAIVREVGSAAPDLVFGRTLGFSEVALFSRGVGLYKMVVERVYALVRGVHFPTFAADVRRGGDAASLYKQAAAYLVGSMAPTLAVLAILSEPLILFVFGDQWGRSVSVAEVICGASILTVPYALVSLSLMGTGHAGACLRMDISTQAVKVLVLLSSIWLPLEQVVSLLVIAYVWEALMAQRALQRVFGLGFLELFRGIRSGLTLVPFAAAVPLIAVWMSSEQGPLQGQRLAVLLIGSTGAVLGWALGLLVVEHPLKSELVRVWSWLCSRLARK